MWIIELNSYLLQRKWILAKMLHILVADNERISGELFWSLYFRPKKMKLQSWGGSSENFQCSTTEIFRYNKKGGITKIPVDRRGGHFNMSNDQRAHSNWVCCFVKRATVIVSLFTSSRKPSRNLRFKIYLACFLTKKNMKILIALAIIIVIIMRSCHIHRICIHLLAKTNSISIIGRRRSHSRRNW